MCVWNLWGCFDPMGNSCIYNLGLEVTRRCNMSCAHCLRGDAECKDMTPEIIDAAFAGVSMVDCLLFTGGEPTLNIPAIEYALKVVKKRNISVGSFCIVTNGKIVSEEFLSVCIKWYAYCYSCDPYGCPETSVVCVSDDEFHENIPDENLGMLKALSFIDLDSKKTDWSKAYMHDKGRAKNLKGYKKKFDFEHDEWVDEVTIERDGDDFIVMDGPIVISADGKVMPYCDYAYEEVDQVSIGSIFEGYEAIFNRYLGEAKAE